MKCGVLLDTHAVIWYLVDPDKLSPVASFAIDSAFDMNAPLFVSAITLVEIVYLGEKRRIPEEAAASIIEALTSDDGFSVVPIDISVVHFLSSIPRDTVPDMPDRIIAATGRMLDIPIVTKDHLIISSSVATIW
jgi:PIN domain nuclease of toxin-antitoxin system